MIQSFDGEQNIGVFIIVKNNSKVLIGKRKNAYKAGWFGFPGGRVGLGESIVGAAKRELFEEVGIISKTCELIGVIREAQEGYDFIHFVALVTAWDGDIQTRELEKCEGWEWRDTNNLPKKILSGHKTGLKLLKGKYRIIDLCQ